MANITPRKRKYSSLTSDCSQLMYGNPVKKLMLEFTEDRSIVKTPAGHSTASLRNHTPDFKDNDKENHHLIQKSTKSQKLDSPPLQTASVPGRVQREFQQRISPISGTSDSSTVSSSSFYSKGKPYLSILERKLANESLPLGPRKDEGNLPIANKTEIAQVKGMPVMKTRSKTSRRSATSRQVKTLSRNAKKAKTNMTPAKSVQQKENINSLVEKKMETPSRILSMKFKPVLKLQTGAAFFSTGKKRSFGSKKELSFLSSQHSVNKALMKEKQERGHVCSELHLSTESKAVKGDRKRDQMYEPLNQKKQDHMEDSGTLSPNTSQDIKTISVPNLSQKTEVLQLPHSNCSNPIDQNIVDAEVSEEISEKSSKKRNEYENASSNKIPIETTKSSCVADVFHPFLSTPDNKKRLHTLPDEPTALVERSPTVQKVPAILKTSKKAKELRKDLKDQMVIDAGQKHFGATVCKACGMVYSAANPEDEAQHIQFHQRFLEGIKYVGWKNERVVAEFWDGKIILVRHGDPKYAIKKGCDHTHSLSPLPVHFATGSSLCELAKSSFEVRQKWTGSAPSSMCDCSLEVEDVRELVDNELGFKQVALASPTQTQTYLFVSVNKIVGCLIAEPVRQAFRVLSEPVDSPTKNSLEHHRAWCCSTKPEKVVCGVSRIWVFSLMRRKGIARRLVDVVRHTFVFGSCLNTDEIAFSDPTPDGKLFAVKYCQTSNFLVYNFLN